MKSLLKDFFWTLASLFSREKDAASILMYHSIGRNDAFFTVRKEEFEKQLQYLRDNHFDVITLSALLERLKQNKSLAHTVVITFDDGYKDNYDSAFPLLKKYQMPATIFLATNYIDGSMKLKDETVLPMLSRQEIQEMTRSGLIECMPHTGSHMRYTGDNLDALMEEVRESRRTVEALTGRSAPLFAYPAGKYDHVLADRVKREGFDGAVTVQGGLVHPDADLFTLKRNAVDSMTSIPQFKGKVSRAIDWYVSIRTRIGHGFSSTHE